MTYYLVIVGLNYPDGNGGERRVEAGDLVSDLPATAIPWLLAGGFIQLWMEPVPEPAVVPLEVPIDVALPAIEGVE